MKRPALLPWLAALALMASGTALAENPMKAYREVEFVQYDVLRTSPDEAAAFAPWRMPPGAPGPLREETLSRQGNWEEVRLSYRFKYPSSADPDIHASSLFDGTLTGFRKIADGQ